MRRWPPVTGDCPSGSSCGDHQPVDAAPVAMAGRGLRHARWAKRFLTFSELPEEAAFRRSYSLYDPGELAHRRRAQNWDRTWTMSIGGTLEVYCDNDLTDHVNRMCLADARPVPARAQPRLHRPGEHGGVHRGADAIRRPRRVPGRLFAVTGDRRFAAAPERSRSKRPRWPGCRSEIVHRPKASFSAPLRAWISPRPAGTGRRSARAGRAGEHGFVQRPSRLRTSSADDRSGREDRSKQIWQLLTLELWYRQSRAAGVALCRSNFHEGSRQMKQVAQNYRSGELAVLDVPPPTCAPGGVLVRSLYSLISTGTELMKVSESKMSLIGKARARPEQVKKVLDTVAQQGPLSAYRKAMNRLDSYTPLGYSLAGVVVGGRAREQRSSASARSSPAPVTSSPSTPSSTGCLSIFVCRSPTGWRLSWPPSPRSGAIALQGVRQAEAQLGDTALRDWPRPGGPAWSSSCWSRPESRSSGLDMVPERCRLAEKAGRCSVGLPTSDGLDRHRDGRWPRRRGASVRTGSSWLRAVASNGPVGAGGTTRPGPGHRRRHRQVQARPALERLLREGAGPAVLPVLRPGTLRQRYEVEGSTTRSGTSAGPNGATWLASWTSWHQGRSTPSPWCRACSRSTDAVEVYERLGNDDLTGVGFLFEYGEPEGPDPAAHVAGQPERRRRSRAPISCRHGAARCQPGRSSASGSSGPATMRPRCCSRISWVTQRYRAGQRGRHPGRSRR